MDVRAASDPKYLPNVTAVRPSGTVAKEAAAQHTYSPGLPPIQKLDEQLAVAEAFRRAAAVFKEIADSLDPVPF